MDYNTVLRLYDAGFIKGFRPAPNTVLLDLQSLYDHMDATTDHCFWTTEHRLRYRDAI